MPLPKFVSVLGLTLTIEYRPLSLAFSLTPSFTLWACSLILQLMGTHAQNTLCVLRSRALEMTILKTVHRIVTFWVLSTYVCTVHSSPVLTWVGEYSWDSWGGNGMTVGGGGGGGPPRKSIFFILPEITRTNTWKASISFVFHSAMFYLLKPLNLICHGSFHKGKKPESSSRFRSWKPRLSGK